MARITATDVHVEFPVYDVRNRSLKSSVLRAATGGLIAQDADRHVLVKALDGVSFELKDGDRVGLIGHNGSGKSTLLRVLAGAFEPVRGRVVVEGRVASMLNIWVGMDQEASGYENIYLRSVIMGFRPRQIRRLVDEIVEFSGLGEYIDMPIRTYSSGMAVRLAFAISTCVAADILLMDEWLSVGDEAFAAKVHARFHDMVGKAKILVLASHDENMIRSNCNMLLRLSQGRIDSLELLDHGVPAASSSAPVPRATRAVVQRIIPAVFMHIQRTAGTTLVELARSRYSASMSSHGEWIARSPAEFAEFQFVSGHFGYEFAKHLMPGRYSFTFLRDPAARIMSLYRFCRTRNPDENPIYRRARELDLASFLEAGLSDPLVKVHVWNNQVWQLAVGYWNPARREIHEYRDADLLELAKLHLSAFTCVGFTETFAQDGRTVCDALGIPIPAKLPVVNFTEPRVAQEMFSPQVRQLLDDLTFLDRELYQYAWQLSGRAVGR